MSLAVALCIVAFVAGTGSSPIELAEGMADIQAVVQSALSTCSSQGPNQGYLGTCYYFAGIDAGIEHRGFFARLECKQKQPGPNRAIFGTKSIVEKVVDACFPAHSSAAERAIQLPRGLYGYNQMSAQQRLFFNARSKRQNLVRAALELICPPEPNWNYGGSTELTKYFRTMSDLTASVKTAVNTAISQLLHRYPEEYPEAHQAKVDLHRLLTAPVSQLSCRKGSLPPTRPGPAFSNWRRPIPFRRGREATLTLEQETTA